MIFGLTLTKFAVILALAVLLFGVPLMTLVVTLIERERNRRIEKGDRWRR